MSKTLRTGLAAKFSLRMATRAALGCALAAALLATAAPAPARAGDDDQNVPVDTKILRGIMESLGLRRDGEAIDYQERAPLVIPPNHDLPPPERSDVAISRNPGWPVDPDVKRRKEEAAQERNQLNADQQLAHDQSVLRPDQLTPGPKPRTTRRSDDNSRPAADGSSGNPLTPSQLGSKGSFFGKLFGKDDPESGRFTGEPPRAALTEPPTGYQTPSPDQPYGVGKAAAPAPTKYMDTHGTVDNGEAN